MKTTPSLLFMSLVFGMALTGCGSDSGGFQLVKDIQVRTFERDGDQYGEVIASIQTGNMNLPAVSFPIFNPGHPGQEYGQVLLRPGIGNGLSDFGVDINISRVGDLDSAFRTLPNGQPVPVGGLGDADLVGVPVGNSSTRVYFAFGDRVALVGVALVIKEFDGIGRKLGPINLFPQFAFANGIRGIAGIFTGTQEKQSGIALFVDAGPVFRDLIEDRFEDDQKTLAVSGVRGMQSALRAGSMASAHSFEPVKSHAIEPSAIVFASTPVSSKKQNQLYSELYRMDRKQTRLHVH